MELTGLGRSLGTRATLRPGCPSVKAARLDDPGLTRDQGFPSLCAVSRSRENASGRDLPQLSPRGRRRSELSVELGRNLLSLPRDAAPTALAAVDELRRAAARLGRLAGQPPDQQALGEVRDAYERAREKRLELVTLLQS
jgi:hypothetical protein